MHTDNKKKKIVPVYSLYYMYTVHNVTVYCTKSLSFTVYSILYTVYYTKSLSFTV